MTAPRSQLLIQLSLKGYWRGRESSNFVNTNIKKVGQIIQLLYIHNDP